MRTFLEYWDFHFILRSRRGNFVFVKKNSTFSCQYAENGLKRLEKWFEKLLVEKWFGVSNIFLRMRELSEI